MGECTSHVRLCFCLKFVLIVVWQKQWNQNFLIVLDHHVFAVFAIDSEVIFYFGFLESLLSIIMICRSSSSYVLGKELKEISHEGMEFDPIRQHRHFCPWIVSTESGAAGWKQTLSALFRLKDLSSPSTKSPSSTSTVKVQEI